MRRLFWLGVGVAAGVALSRKARNAARQATPAGLAANLGAAMRELAGAIGAFGADVRAGMAEREEELSEVVEQRSGVSPVARRAMGARPDARARRADG
ncbi:MAG TPA: hypothetical protein VGX25_09655 [Actinophytocola sp.]|uniref:hypothetical protein n=1 Tax=Actinophytocola sp. TaxID=1872138 RepID=UPI002DDD4E21|nr:hypothetical protein [Actinophytocola sp.]HEV2779652.1 hypothetical protein [Actinophytocola sp.]